MDLNQSSWNVTSRFRSPTRRRRTQSRKWPRSYAVLAMVGLLGSAVGAEINPPIGPHTAPKESELALAKVFGTNDPVVMTSYFYWYDVYSGAHIVNSDGSDALTDHPPTLTGFSYKSTSWHQRQLEDMIAAGIDVALPVYWGEPSQRVAGKPVSQQPWSFAGIPPLIEAREKLVTAGKTPPAIGLFYDTSTLQFNEAGRRIDLTTDYGRRWFYETIRDFFSLVPARHWATIEGRPIILLYSSGFAAAHDQSCIDYVRQEFAKDFSGCEPYIVKEISWNVKADNTYAWGGAISLRNPGVAALGPGYDHSAVPGREPLVVPRENGAFFERNWLRFLRAPSRLLHVETWNEYHEGTDIAESREYGRQYIELNRKFADMFKAGIKPPRPRGEYSEFKSVNVVLLATNETHGVTQFEHADGATAAAERGGRNCRVTAPTSHQGRYIYFLIDDSFKWADSMTVDVSVEYFDQGTGSFRIEYDGPDPNAPFNGAYTGSPTVVQLSNSGSWKTAKIRLPDARFLNSQNGGGDFRIAVSASELCVGKVTVTRPGQPEESGATLPGWQEDFQPGARTNWLTTGAPGAFDFRGSVLRVGPAAEGPTLLLTQSRWNGEAFEILARIRPLSPEPTPNFLGGIVIASSATGETVYGALFRREGNGATSFGLISSGDDHGPFIPLPWQTNRWYWLRVRHEPTALTGSPDLLARLWLADGVTPEPSAWTVWRDYFPAGSAVGAYVGLSAGQGVFEVDWFLLKGEPLAEVVARPPGLKPALATLGPLDISPTSELRLALRGDPGVGYLIESTTDFIEWKGVALTTGGDGTAVFEDNTLARSRFYRAREVR